MILFIATWLLHLQKRRLERGIQGGYDHCASRELDAVVGALDPLEQYQRHRHRVWAWRRGGGE